MQEELLHFIWRYKYFSPLDLATADGQPVRVIRQGDYNTNAGPDFLNAQVQIGDTLWAGNVELHLRASDWDAHSHSADKAYNNVILHVVYDNDRPVKDKPDMPVLQLSGFISDETLQKYKILRASKSWIPCQDQLVSVPELVKDMWLERMLVERLEAKAQRIAALLKQNNNDWAETAYQLCGRNFGFKVNSDAFEALTRALPQKIIAKHKNSLFQIEALIFGQAGMLEGDFTDEYPIALQKEFRFLAAKYSLTPLESSRWKFLRLRPGNFPTIRLSQFAALVRKSEHLFSLILDTKSHDDIKELFDIKASHYWERHHKFESVSSKKEEKNLGREARDNLIINTVSPLLFAYGHLKDQPAFKTRALKFLEDLRPENNNITRQWQQLGLDNRDAGRSQALLQLKSAYCEAHRCLECGIGGSLLRPSRILRNREN